MGERSAIEWTDSTWNPIRARNLATGQIGWHCEHATTGCQFCYSEGFNRRLGTGLDFKPGHRKDIEIFLDEKMLLAPLRWKKPRMIFVCSMTDLFADFVKDEWIDRIFAVMALCPQHTFQVLTKRAGRMLKYMIEPSRISRLKHAMLVLDSENTIRWENGERGVVSIDFEKLPSWAYLTGQPCHSTCRPPCKIAWTADGESTLPLHLFDGEARPAGECWGRAFWDGPLGDLPNVWLGVSAERQQEADERIPDLLQTPAAVRFVSLEPLLGPIDLYHGDPDPRLGGHKAKHTFLGDWWEPGDNPQGPSRHGVDWVIAGGESGPHARLSHPDWYRSLRDQCAAAEVAFFMKQWGEWAPHKVRAGGDLGGDVRAGRVKIVHPTGQTDVEVSEATGGFSTIPGSRYMARVGKKAAGRLLDGVEHNGMPNHA